MTLPANQESPYGLTCRRLPALSSLALLFAAVGCGMSGAPQPPSLRLPETVNDLTAVRAGDTVLLNWTMPKKTTDHLTLTSQIRGPISVRVCAKLPGSDVCQTEGESSFAPDAEASYAATLPDVEAHGRPHPLMYYVELRNRSGQSAGLSNSAVIAAGQAPAAVEGFSADVRADGVTLHWKADGVDKSSAVRLHRMLVSVPAPMAKKLEAKPTAGTPAENPIRTFGAAGTSSEPVLRDLLVSPSDAPGSLSGALDKTAHFGEVYEYTAQRVQELKLDGKSLELDGAISKPIRVDVVDTFPPAVPQGLVAVAAPADNSSGTGATIDLSWQPDTEGDLAGYIVYRTTDGESADGQSESWSRISGPQPLTGPAFRDTQVKPGQGYRYTVTAIDQGGHESKHSPEAQETVPSS